MWWLEWQDIKTVRCIDWNRRCDWPDLRLGYHRIRDSPLRLISLHTFHPIFIYEIRKSMSWTQTWSAWVSCCIWRTLRLCIQVNILIRDVWICQLLLKIVVHEAKLSAGVEHGGHCRHYAQVTLLPLYGHCRKVIEGSGITICPSCRVFF